MEYGRNVIGSTGMPIQVIAGGANEAEFGQGISVDWTTVSQTGAGTPIYPEGLTVPSGVEYLRYGQVMTKITNQPVYTVTINGSPTGGTWTLLVQRPDTLAYAITSALSYEISAAALQAAIVAALVGVQQSPLPWPITVTGTTGTSGAPSGPFTITTPAIIVSGDATDAWGEGTGLTGGTSPSVSVTLTTANGNYGMYGPYDPAASDGRQNLNFGEVGILNTTVLQQGLFGFTMVATNHPPLIRGGRIWAPRVIATTGSASLANGPTWASLMAVMPRLQLVDGYA